MDQVAIAKEIIRLGELLLAEQREAEFRRQMAAVRDLVGPPVVPIGRDMSFDEWRVAEVAAREKRRRDGEGSRRRWADMRSACTQRGRGRWIVNGREELGEFPTIHQAYAAKLTTM